MTSAPRPAPAGPPAARCVGLTKQYGKGDTVVHALAGVDVEFASGRFTAIMGPSGSGKSTLMHCMAALDSPTAGSVFVGEVEVSRLDDKRLTRLRRDRIGFVFQAYNLVPTLTALENITLPADIAGRPVERAWLDEVITTLGLQDRLRHRPSELSGGQQQRVACARALAGRPAIVFADEPTGNLDSRTSAEVLGFLAASVRRTGLTVAMVTHDPTAAAFADRVLFLADGRIVDEMTDPTAERVLERMKAFDADAPPAPVTWAPAPAPASAPAPGWPAVAAYAPDPLVVPAPGDGAPQPVSSQWTVTASDPVAALDPTRPVAPPVPPMEPVSAAALPPEPPAPAPADATPAPSGMADWSDAEWDLWLREKQAQAAAAARTGTETWRGEDSRADGVTQDQPHQQPQGRPAGVPHADNPPGTTSNGKGHGDPFAHPPFTPEA